MRINGMVRGTLSCGLALALGSGSVVAAQNDGGFGMRKTKVLVTTVFSPKILLRQSTFSIDVTGTSSDREMRELIKNATKTIVQKAKQDIRFVESNGQLRINVTIDQFKCNREPKTKVKKKFGIVGGEAHNYVTVHLNFRATCRIDDWTTGDPVHVIQDFVPHDIPGKDYDETAGDIAPTVDSLKQQCVDKVVGFIESRINKTDQKFNVLLPEVDGDKLKPGTAFAEANQWQEALGKWEALAPFSNPKADSYRLYSLGVAYEVLGYKTFQAKEGADSAIEAVAYFEKAKEFYKTAIDKNPQEENFQKPWEALFSSSNAPAPLARVEDAIKVYSQWKSFKKAEALTAQSQATKSSFAPSKKSSSRPPAAARNKNVFTNETIIEYFKAGVEEQELLDIVAGAPATRFDLSPEGTKVLIDAGIPTSVRNLMRKKQRGGR
jgi:hypothetical protein